MRWQPAGAATALVVLLLLFLSDDPQPWRAVMLLQLAAIILACGTCFVLDDDAADLLAASPTTLAWRRALRVAAAVVLVAPVWAVTVVVVTQRSGVDLPVLALTLELAALVAVGLAAAAAIERWLGLPDAGVAAAPLLFLLTFLAFRLPQRAALFVAPEADQIGVNLRWAVLLVAALLLLAWCNRDAARSWTQRSGRRGISARPTRA